MNDTVTPQVRKPQFDVGRVINRTFGAIKNNFVSFFLASLLIMGLPVFLLGILPIFMGMEGMMDGDQISDAYLSNIMVTAAIGFVVMMAGSVILQGALIFGAVEDFNGRKASFGECIGVALKYFFPLLGLGILLGLGTLLGMLVFLIPGLILALGWTIAAPILIVEREGVTDSIARSWDLSKGYKRWILLLVFMMMVVSFILGIIQSTFSLMLGDPTEVLMTGGTPTYHFVNSVFSAIVQTITSMISATGVAAIYYEIRQIKEGIGPESLAAVFD